jgi:glutamate--cysteine ligase
MPSLKPVLTQRGARERIASRYFGLATGAVGAEVEFLSMPIGEPRRRPDVPLMRELCAAPLGGGSVVTFEPGGQVEVSSRPLALRDAITAAGADVSEVRARLGLFGVRTVGLGLDPLRPDRRAVFAPRYDAMERFFDARGVAGRRMMCGTAAVQINVDAGRDVDARWRLAHALGPVLAASFANSPFDAGASTGWRSARLPTWWAIDPSRTAPAISGHGARDDWVRYALDAAVMMIRVSPEDYRALREDLSFARWIERGHELGYPTEDDLDYHLTTLFPPVRPRGWLELRMIDALPEPWWRAAVAVAAALVEDDEAAARAARACRPVEEMWVEAARDGLAHPGLAGAADECFRAALDALPRLGADASTAAVVEAFYERFVARHRCPADDLLDSWASGGSLFPADDEDVDPVRVR